MKTKRWMLVTMAVLAGSLLAAPALTTAQDRPDREAPEARERGDRPERRNRRDWNPEEMRKRMMQMMQERLGATDEEWEVLGPRVEKVMEKQRETRPRMGRRFGGRDRGGDQPEAEQSDLGKKAQALGELLREDNPDADKVAAALKAYREAKEAAEEELAAAQKELVEVLTVKQEAQLVMMGMLE